MHSGIIISEFYDTCCLNLHTTEKNQIDNQQFRCISSLDFSVHTTFETDYSLAKFKGRLTPIYNCHGMTFASRRTGIYDDAEIEKILKDDNYIEIKALNDVLAGDVVIYYQDNSITHSGIILSNDILNGMRCIFVLSKWAKHKEVIHALNYCPYATGIKRFWRINHGFKII